MTATYTKLRSGDWGVRVQGEAPALGSVVIVTKRDGSTKTETVNRIVWQGDGIALVAIQQRPRFAGRGAGAAAETKVCWECGCSFTYGDAKRRGGDWSDSYCGC